MRAEALGVVLFDSPSTYSPESENPGYLCLPDTEPVRIFGTGDLPSDVRWLTNINLDVARAARLKNSPKLLNTNFLRTSVSTILSELGLSNRPVSVQAYALAHYFRNTMTLADSLLGISGTPAFSLNQAIPVQISHYQPSISEQVRQFSVQSHQSYTQCEVSAGRDSKFTSVTLPRQAHAAAILTAGLPWGGWEKLPLSGVASNQSRVDYVLGCGRPAIAQITVTKVSKKFNQLVNYGAGAGMLSAKTRTNNDYAVPNGRHCATSNELKFLAEIADVTVDEVYVCDSPVEVRYGLPVETVQSGLSYSYGLLCENIWTSLSRDTDGRVSKSPMSAWLHAEDRLACLRKAISMHDLGYKILGYGYGRVNIALEQEMLDRYHTDCMQLGVVPAMGLAVSDVVSISESPSPEELFNGLICQGAYDTILDLDNQFVNESANAAELARGVESE